MKNDISYYKLGRHSFGVETSNSELRDFLDRLLPACEETTAGLDIVNIDQFYGSAGDRFEIVQEFDIISYLMNMAFEKHPRCLWMDAAAVVTPDQKCVLLAGQSHSGKSTLSLALAFAKHWKVVSEDIVLIDSTADQIIAFAAPFSVRAGSIERIEQATGITPGPVFAHDRIPALALSCRSELKAQFDFAFYLDPIVQNDISTEPVVEAITISNCLHHLLPISNAVRLDRGADKLMQYLEKSTCYRLSSGDLEGRYRSVIQLCSA